MADKFLCRSNQALSRRINPFAVVSAGIVSIGLDPNQLWKPFDSCDKRIHLGVGVAGGLLGGLACHGYTQSVHAQAFKLLARGALALSHARLGPLASLASEFIATSYLQHAGLTLANGAYSGDTQTLVSGLFGIAAIKGTVSMGLFRVGDLIARALPIVGKIPVVSTVIGMGIGAAMGYAFRRAAGERVGPFWSELSHEVQSIAAFHVGNRGSELIIAGAKELREAAQPFHDHLWTGGMTMATAGSWISTSRKALITPHSAKLARLYKRFQHHEQTVELAIPGTNQMLPIPYVRVQADDVPAPLQHHGALNIVSPHAERPLLFFIDGPETAHIHPRHHPYIMGHEYAEGVAALHNLSHHDAHILGTLFELSLAFHDGQLPDYVRSLHENSRDKYNDLIATLCLLEPHSYAGRLQQLAAKAPQDLERIINGASLYQRCPSALTAEILTWERVQNETAHLAPSSDPQTLAMARLYDPASSHEPEWLSTWLALHEQILVSPAQREDIFNLGFGHWRGANRGERMALFPLLEKLLETVVEHPSTEHRHRDQIALLVRDTPYWLQYHQGSNSWNRTWQHAMELRHYLDQGQERELVAIGATWARDTLQNPGWPFVAKRLTTLHARFPDLIPARELGEALMLRLERVGTEGVREEEWSHLWEGAVDTWTDLSSSSKASLAQIGIDRIRNRAPGLETPFILAALLDRHQEITDFISLAELSTHAGTWVRDPSTFDMPGWTNLWRSLSNGTANSSARAELLCLGSRWLEGRESHGYWHHVWLRLHDLRLEFPPDLSLALHCERGYGWLQQNREHHGWEKIWKTLLASQDEHPYGRDLAQEGMDWLDRHSRNLPQNWPFIYGTVLERRSELAPGPRARLFTLVLPWLVRNRRMRGWNIVYEKTLKAGYRGDAFLEMGAQWVTSHPVDTPQNQVLWLAADIINAAPADARPIRDLYDYIAVCLRHTASDPQFKQLQDRLRDVAAFQNRSADIQRLNRALWERLLQAVETGESLTAQVRSAYGHGLMQVEGIYVRIKEEEGRWLPDLNECEVPVLVTRFNESNPLAVSHRRVLARQAMLASPENYVPGRRMRGVIAKAEIDARGNPFAIVDMESVEAFLPLPRRETHALHSTYRPGTPIEVVIDRATPSLGTLLVILPPQETPS